MSERSVWACAALAVLSVATTVPAAIEYDVTNLGAINTISGYRASRGAGISSNGLATGTGPQSLSPSGSQTLPFIYDSSTGTLTKLPNIDGNATSTYGTTTSAVNSSGQAGGYSTLSSGSIRPYLYTNGTGVNLNDSAGWGSSPTQTGFVRDLNDAGQIVGIRGGANSSSTRAVVATVNAGGVGTTVELPFLTGAAYDRTDATAVSGTGTIAGWTATANSGTTRRAVVWTPDGSGGYTAQNIGYGQATGVNDQNTVLYYNADNRAFMSLDDDGAGSGTSRTDVEIFRSGAGYIGSYTNTFTADVNNDNVAVGAISVIASSGLPTRSAFIWDQLQGMRELTALIEGGFQIRDALGINDAGQIIAYGYMTGGGTTEYALLLTPVPEPTAVALLGMGGLILLRRRRTCAL